MLPRAVVNLVVSHPIAIKRPGLADVRNLGRTAVVKIIELPLRSSVCRARVLYTLSCSGKAWYTSEVPLSRLQAVRGVYWTFS